MTRRRDALLVTPVTPALAGNGLAMRAGLLLEGLARSHRVRVLVVPVFGGARPPGQFVARHAAGFTIARLAPASDPVGDAIARLGSPAARSRTGALHPLPPLARAGSPAAADAVADAASGCAAVLVTRLYLAPVLDALLGRGGGQRLVLDVDDVESDLHAALGDVEQAQAYARLEGHYLPQVDLVMTCSEPDAERLAARHRMRQVAVVPNAVRLPEAREVRAESRYDLLFVGNLAYRPNVEAVVWLCERVLPLLPRMSVAVVGSAPVAEVHEQARHAGVTLAADVLDVGPWYAGARVAVAPLRHGGGTPIKVLEALAHGRPVVATPAAVRGLADVPVLLADASEDFAQACGQLLGDAGLRAQLAKRGREWVRDHAAVSQVAGVIDGLLANLFADERQLW